jgi:hypothetical protein
MELRRAGTILLEVDLIHDDDDGQALAREAMTVVERFVRSKGYEPNGGTVSYRELEAPG